MIYKIGGAAINSAKNLETCTEFINNMINNRQENNIFFIVISAFGKSTSTLQQAIDKAVEGNLDLANNLIDSLFNFYSDISKIDIKIFNHYIFDLKSIVQGLYLTKEFNKKVIDKILSFGEKISIFILNYFLVNRTNHVSFNDLSFVISNSNFGNANVNYELSKKNFFNLMDNNSHIYIFPGFIAQDIYNNPTTMGLESSNLTAILIAEYESINNLYYISDVDGIYSGDPKIVENAKLLNHLSLDSALKAGRYGLPLFHLPTIRHSIENNLNLFFGNFENSVQSRISNDGLNEKMIIINNKNNLNQIILINIGSENFNEILSSINVEFLNSINFDKENSEVVINLISTEQLINCANILHDKFII